MLECYFDYALFHVSAIRMHLDVSPPQLSGLENFTSEVYRLWYGMRLPLDVTSPVSVEGAGHATLLPCMQHPIHQQIVFMSRVQDVTNKSAAGTEFLEHVKFGGRDPGGC